MLANYDPFGQLGWQWNPNGLQSRFPGSLADVAADGDGFLTMGEGRFLSIGSGSNR